MKLIDVLKLDCRNKEQKKELIEKFKSIDYVRKNLTDVKDNNEVEAICMYIIDKMKFKRNAIFWRVEQKTSSIVDLRTGKFYTVYSISSKELYIKMAVFSYYFRQKQKVERGRK